MIAFERGTPAKTFAEACERVRDLQSRDGASILPQAHTQFAEHGTRTALAVVLLHGFTNHPGQFVQLLPQAAQKGWNVLAPRLPEHGDRNRMTTRLASITAERLLAAAWDATNIACGLGDAVAVLGISTSGLLAASLGQYRDDVALAVPVSPVFALLRLPYLVSRSIAVAALHLPNAFLWWDPRERERQLPSTAYPRFPTRGLAQAMRIGDDIMHASHSQAARARRIVTVANARDPAVNNRVTAAVTTAWQARGGNAAQLRVFDDLPANHDILDPENSQQRVDLVYPRLLDILEGKG